WREKMSNPLEALGFSPTFKKLKLTKEQKFEYVLRVRKVLLSLIHPDRGGSHEAYVKFQQETQCLSTKEGFNQALQELQPESKVISELQAYIVDLKDDIERLQARVKKHVNDRWIGVREAHKLTGISEYYLKTYWSQLGFPAKEVPSQGLRF